MQALGCLISLIALLLFARLARDTADRVFDPLFDLVNGDASALKLVLVVFLAVFFVATWIWSARARRPRPAAK